MAKTDNKRLYILLGILGVLFIYLILNNTVFANKDKVPTRTENANKKMAYAATEKVPDNNKNTKKDVKKKIKYPSHSVRQIKFDGDWQSDPFFYLDEDSLRSIRDQELGQYTDLRLSGISLLQGKGYSLINSVVMTDMDTVMTASILKEGDEFEGFRVVKIGFDHVILRRGNRNIRLELDES